jgi:DNA helicase-2/ATP-dependent DNA helicase PcrA
METLCGPRVEEGLKTLSPAQRAVVTHRGGPLLVVAGAGSGKTRALTYRTAYLVETGIAPEQILISTFTNKAAQEFRERLTLLLGEGVNRLRMGTLHATGAKILRTFGELAHYPTKFPIYTRSDSNRLLKRVIAECGFDKEALTLKTLGNEISRYKEKLITPDEAIITAKSKSDFDLDIAKAYAAYQKFLTIEQAMDFDDLIMKTVQLLQQYPDVRRRLGLEYLLVDEFQDTDHAQFSMIKLLLGPEQNLTAVGDIDQAIYSFRGADHQIMCNFTKHFPTATVHSLGKNYRCSKKIVSAAAKVIEQNEDRIVHELSTDNPDGESIILMKVQNETDEAARVTTKIKTIQRLTGCSYSEIAVLYRTNWQSQAIEDHFIRAGIPYHIVGARFFDRREILDVMSYLRVIENENDSAAWHEILTKPERKISETAMKHITEMMVETDQPLAALIKDPSQLPIMPKQRVALSAQLTLVNSLRAIADRETLPRLISMTMEITGIKAFYKEKESGETLARGASGLDNLNRLLALTTDNYAGIATETLPELLQYASLLSDERDDADGVQMMTLHASKGTEYRVVFLLGVEEDLIPHQRAKCAPDTASAIEEERRLFYVGMTRAKHLLFFTLADRRNDYSQRPVACRYSRFLESIPANLMVTPDL